MVTDIITMGTMDLSPIISTIPQQAGYPASTPQTDFAAGRRLFSIEVWHAPAGPGQVKNYGAMG
jgi:hypothetical protein